jgi:hypothetical protein
MKKMEEAIEKQEEVVEDEEEKKDTEADEMMEGYMVMTKTKLEDEKKGIDLTNLVGDIQGIGLSAFKQI